MKAFVLKWYPVILAFICMLYSITLGLLGRAKKRYILRIGQVRYYYLH